MENQLLDSIVEVDLIASRMRVLVEGALILFDDETNPCPDTRQNQAKVHQAINAIGLALYDLRELICRLQTAFAALSDIR